MSNTIDNASIIPELDFIITGLKAPESQKLGQVEVTDKQFGVIIKAASPTLLAKKGETSKVIVDALSFSVDPGAVGKAHISVKNAPVLGDVELNVVLKNNNGKVETIKISANGVGINIGLQAAMSVNGFDKTWGVNDALIGVLRDQLGVGYEKSDIGLSMVPASVNETGKVKITVTNPNYRDVGQSLLADLQPATDNFVPNLTISEEGLALIEELQNVPVELSSNFNDIDNVKMNRLMKGLTYQQIVEMKEKGPVDYDILANQYNITKAEELDLVNTRYSIDEVELKNRYKIILDIFKDVCGTGEGSFTFRACGERPVDTKEGKHWDQKQLELATFMIRYYSRKEKKDDLDGELGDWMYKTRQHFIYKQ